MPNTAFRVATRRNFAPFFAGNALSASGTWFYNLAASLLVYRQTGSPFLLGVLNFAQFIPVLVLVPWAGAAADRYDRKHVVLVTQAAAAVLSLALGLLVAFDSANEWVVIGFALAFGVCSAFAAPAAMALPASLVPPSDLGAAVALNSMTYNIARAAGPALAAAAIAAFGIAPAFFINGVTYIVFIALLLLVTPAPQRRAPQARFRESFALLRAQPRLVWLLFVVMAVGFASDPINTESPAFAVVFGQEDTFAGAIIGVFGFGAVTAAFFFAGREGSPRTTVATLALMALSIAGFALSPSLELAFVFLFLAGFGYLASNARATTQLQLEVDETQRGRIMALWSIAFLGLRPIASLVDGVVADLFGVRAAGVVLAVPAALAALLIWRRIRR